MLLERTAGSHALAAAAQRQRSAQMPTVGVEFPGQGWLPSGLGPPAVTKGLN